MKSYALTLLIFVTGLMLVFGRSHLWPPGTQEYPGSWFRTCHVDRFEMSVVDDKVTAACVVGGDSE